MDGLDVMAMLRATQQFERNLSVALMYSGLRIPQFRLLDILDNAGQATVTELSSALNIARATASVMVNELIKSGIVAVIEHPGDRRSFHVRLTEHGRHKLSVARSDVGVFRDRLSRRFSSETINILNEFSRSRWGSEEG